MPATADTPKCFANVQSKRILDWGLEALAAADIRDICFIGGYQIDKVRAEYPHFTFRHNRDWPHNNILVSLMHAEDLMNEPFLCAYSDILFTADVIKRLLANPSDIVLSVDTRWLERYQHRTQHPPADAEKVTATNGRVTRIDRGIDPREAHGEYTGVARFSADGAAMLKQHYHRCRARRSGQPFREAAVFERAYLIHLFQEMIEAGVKMAHADTPGEYMEIDTQQDFELAQTHWKAPV